MNTAMGTRRFTQVQATLRCNTLLLLVWWIALGLLQYKGELVRLELVSEERGAFATRRGASLYSGPVLLPAHWAGRDTTIWRPTLVVGLGLLGGRATVLAAQRGRQVTSPSSGSAVQDSFHQRGKLWAPLWRVQRPALLCTPKSHVLCLRR